LIKKERKRRDASNDDKEMAITHEQKLLV